MSEVSAGPLLDAEARRRATTDFDLNLVVVAGAGAGKTAILVERTLNLIGSGAALLEDVALITFTEKAAAGLRQRLQTGLDALSRRAGSADRSRLDPGQDADRSWIWLTGGGIDPAAVRQRALAALRALDGAAIGTIHAFCAEILRRHPRAAGVDPRFAVDEGAAFDRLFALEWEQYLGRELGREAPRLDLWRRAIGHADGLGPVRDLARALARFTLPAAALGPYVPADARGLLALHARSALESLRAVEHLGARCAPKMQASLRACAVLLAAFLRDGMEGLLAAEPPVTLDDLVLGSPPEPGAKLAPDESRAIKAAVRPSRDLLRGLAAVDEEAVGAVFESARDLGSRARGRLLCQGFVSFDGLLRLTRDLLAEKPALRRAIARRHRRILVDEFQDTDPLQYEILFYLAEADGEPAADAYDTDLAPGRLFIVGDPKQSIYRFRGADIAAFHRAVQHLLRRGGAQLTLTTSFRSPEPLLRPINTLFDGWIGEGGGWRDDYEPPYDPITSGRPPGASAPRLEIWSVPEDGDAEARRAAEAAAIASWIAAHARRPSDEGRRLHFRDIAILLRALTNAGLYAAALRRAGIPFVVDGGKDFYERPEVGDLIAFLRAAANPNDTPALLAVLRSPLGAVPDEEMARFAAAGGRLDQAREARPDLGPFSALRLILGLVDAFRTRTRGWPADAVIQEALDGTPLPLLHAATHDGAQRLANLRKLAAAAQRHARLGLSLAETLRLAEEDFETSIGEGESPLADESIDAVRVLSIHKAKGLEYPVVVVPDVGRESERRPHDDAAVAAWSAGAPAGAAAAGAGGRVAVRLPGGRSNAAWVLHEIENRRHEAAEEKRLFYVACTRARERLILVNSHRSGNAAWRSRLAALGYAIEDGAWPAEGFLQDGLVEHKVIRPERVARLAGAEPPVEALLAAAAAAGSVARQAAASALPPLHWPSGTHPKDRDAADLVEGARPLPDAASGAGGGPGAVRGAGAGPGPVARLAGMAVHAALSAWLSQREAAGENSGGPLPDPGRLPFLGRREARLAVDEALPPGRRGALLHAVTSEVEEILEAFLGSPLPSRLAAAEILGTEVPILFRDGGGRTWTGACDLLFREGGSVVVADFKTDKVISDATTTAERYREQIGIYVEAVRRAMPGARLRGEALFVRSGDAVVLLPNPPDAG